MKIYLWFQSSNGKDQFGHVGRVKIKNVKPEIFEFVNSHHNTTLLAGDITHWAAPREVFVRFHEYDDMVEFKLMYGEYFE